MWQHLDWLIARPIAHRGLHDADHGVIENTPSAVRAAIAANYGIEVDVQITADGEAMVHHDDVLGRLTEGEGRLDQLTAAELKTVPFRGTNDRMMTLGDLCDLVGGRVTMLVELKSRFDGDVRLPARVAAVLANYRGPVAPMSFDPTQLAHLQQINPALAARDHCRQIPAAPILGPDAALDAAWHGLSGDGIDRATAIRGLFDRRPAGPGAFVRAARFKHAAADLGGADTGRTATRHPLGRSDDF